jgi:CTP synthase (UTP-ammonia lyase)
MRIAIVGDYDPQNITHTATDRAFAQLSADADWIATPTLVEQPSSLEGYQGVFIAPCVPCLSMEGALGAIRYARERDLPLLGTCGGFQLAVVEFARNRVGIAGADHAETNPDAEQLVVVPLACSLAGQQHPVEIEPGSLAAETYGSTTTTEPFFCSYGVSPDYREQLERAGMRISGFDRNDEPRIVELPDHRFFLATLYVPQANSRPDDPHPLLVGFLDAIPVPSH